LLFSLVLFSQIENSIIKNTAIDKRVITHKLMPNFVPPTMIGVPNNSYHIIKNSVTVGAETLTNKSSIIVPIILTP
jgi:hypothetical protein